MSLKDLSVVAASNTATPPDGAPEGSFLLGDISDTFRQTLAVIRSLAAADTIAAATTTDIGTKVATFLTLTGAAATITGLGTVSAGIWKVIIYNDAHTLTYNATSLILIGNASRTVAAGDISLFISEGSGNWRELFYSPDAGFQPLDTQLTDIAALTPTDSNIIVGNGTTWVAESGATARTSLGLAIGTDVQAYDADLAALAGLTSAANKVPMFSGSGTATVIDFLDEDAMTSNSATAVPSQQSVKAYVDTQVATAGGAWALVETWTATAAANKDFDLQEDVYCQWVFQLDGIIPGTDDTRILMRPGYSAGTVFDTANASGMYLDMSTPAWATVNDYNVIGFAAVGIGTAAGEHGHATVTIGGVGSTLSAGFMYESKCSFIDATANHRSTIINAGYNNISERVFDSVRFIPSAGSFEATGTIKMFGLKRAG